MKSLEGDDAKTSRPGQSFGCTRKRGDILQYDLIDLPRHSESNI